MTNIKFYIKNISSTYFPTSSTLICNIVANKLDSCYLYNIKHFMKRLILLSIAFSFFSCSREDDHDHDDNEAITSVQLTFTPTSNTGEEKVFTWKDGAGQLVELSKNEEYNLEVDYLNESGLEKKEITEEIEEESDAHLVIIKTTPTDLMGITTLDKDSKGRKLGLKNKVKVKNAAANGSIRVILKHQPPVNGKELKDGMDETLGSTDSDVSFSVIVK